MCRFILILLLGISVLFSQTNNYSCECYLANISIKSPKNTSCSCNVLGILPYFKVKKDYKIKLSQTTTQKEIYLKFIDKLQRIDKNIAEKFAAIHKNIEENNYVEYLTNVKELKKTYSKLPDSSKQKITIEIIKISKDYSTPKKEEVFIVKDGIPAEISLKINHWDTKSSYKIYLRNNVLSRNELLVKINKNNAKLNFKYKPADKYAGYYSLHIVNEELLEQITVPVFIDTTKINITVYKDSIIYKGSETQEKFTEFFQPIWALIQEISETENIFVKLKAKKIFRYVYNYALNNPDKIYVYTFIYSEMSQLKKSELEKIISSGEKALPKNYYLEQIKSIVLNPGSDIAYNFSLPDSSGNFVSLKDFRGQYVLLNFWASWCSPCIKELPILKDLHKKGIVIISISLDENKQNWIKALKKYKPEWINILGNKQIAEKFNVITIPRNILISPEGYILEEEIPPTKLKKVIGKYISE